ncbi:MAG: hypothetical protein JWR75_514 [Devosia sp.]|nr:hypothetical protein [Devosia sp.]
MTKIRLLAAALLALVPTAPVLAAEQYFPANEWGQVEFIMPSGNVGCHYTPAGGTDFYETLDGEAELYCDRIEPSYVRAVLTGSGKGKAYKNPGEQGCCSTSPKFKYGNTLDLGEFYCWSRQTGLICERIGEDHGFSLAKAGVKTW